jgi:hypothetical protein
VRVRGSASGQTRGILVIVTRCRYLFPDAVPQALPHVTPRVKCKVLIKV